MKHEGIYPGLFKRERLKAVLERIGEDDGLEGIFSLLLGAALGGLFGLIGSSALADLLARHCQLKSIYQLELYRNGSTRAWLSKWPRIGKRGEDCGRRKKVGLHNVKNGAFELQSWG